MKSFLVTAVWCLLLVCFNSFISAAMNNKNLLIEHNWGFSTWIRSATIGDGVFSQPDNNIRSPPFNVPWFGQPIQSAILYVSGVGYSSVSINGKPCLDLDGNQNVLEPGLTDFHVGALYVAYDVLKDLIVNTPDKNLTAQNIIGIQLGYGWQMPLAYNMVPKARAELVIDGNVVLSATGNGTADAWVSTRGPIRYDNIYNGELYNASYEIPGWDSAAIPPTNYAVADVGPVTWTPVFSYVNNNNNSSNDDHQYYNPVLRPRKFPGVRVIKEFSPQNSWKPDPNTLVVDFGIEISGFATLTVNGSQGQVQAHYGEVLDHYDEGMSQYVYYENLRSALATDTFVLPVGLTSSQVFSYTPKFTYHGFRFVQINATGDIDLDFIATNIVALQVHTALEQISQFDSQTTVFNEIHTRVVGSQINNVQSYFSDCNQRDERLPWDGDLFLSSVPAANNFELMALFENTVINIASDQTSTGAIADVEPYVRLNWGARPADPAWGIVLPGLTSLHYSESQSFDDLFKTFPYSAAWANVLIGIFRANGITNVNKRYGDWVPPPPVAKVSNGFSAACAFIATLDEMRIMAANLNNISAFTSFTNLLKNEVYPQFISKYFNATAQTFDIGGVQQTTYAYPLSLPGAFQAAVVAANNDEKLKDNLLNLVEQSDYHLNTGILGLRHLFTELSRTIGRPDVAGQILIQTTYPSYAYEWLNDVETPSTDNLWEVWDAPAEGPSMNSRDHHMDSSVDLFLFENVGGLLSASTTTSYAAKKHLGKRLDTAQETVAESIKNIQENIYNKYASYKTVVLDASIVSYDIPSLRSNRVSKKFTNTNTTVSFSWTKEGGENLCYQFYRFSKDHKNRQDGEFVVLDCGVNGGVISDIDLAFVGNSQGTCASLHKQKEENSDNNNSELQKQHDVKIFAELRRRCVGNRGCRLSSSKWWNEKIGHKRTDSLVVRGRCSAPSRVTMEIDIKTSSSSNKKQDFELFVPTFGFHDAEIQLINSVPDKIQSLHIQRDPVKISQHPLFDIMPRSRMHKNEKPAMVLVHGVVSHKFTVVLTESTKHKQKQNHVLSSIATSSQQQPKKNIIKMNEKCSQQQQHQNVVAIDRINTNNIHKKCGKNSVSITRLISEIEIECVNSSNDYACVEKVAWKNVFVSAAESSAVICKEAILENVSLKCGP